MGRKLHLPMFSISANEDFVGKTIKKIVFTLDILSLNSTFLNWFGS